MQFIKGALMYEFFSKIFFIPRRGAIFAAAFCLAAALPSAAATLPPEVRQIMKRHGIAQGKAGVVVHRVGEDRPLLSHRAGAPFNPASLTKLPLAFAAFDILGPAHRWQTTFSYTGEIRGDTLNGDLIITGGGDPHLTMERVMAQVNDLRSRGLRVLRGDILIDDSRFALPPHDKSAFDGAPHKPYNVGAGALAVNLNAHKVVLSPSPQKIHIYVEPPNDNFVIENKLRIGKTRCRNWRGRILERYRGDENKITLTLRGNYSPRCGEQAFYTTALSQAANAAGVFSALWKRMGGEWRGEWRVAESPPDAKTIAVFESPPLHSAVTAMNKFSNNAIARNIFLSLAGATHEPPFTPVAARSVFGEWMRGLGVEGEFYAENGSGLSRDGILSAGQTAFLLRKIAAHPLRAEIISSLPVLGIDGTLRKRLQKTARARGHLKTGSLNGVKNIAGFLRDDSGREIIFVCFVEASGARARRFQDALIKWTLAQ